MCPLTALPEIQRDPPIAPFRQRALNDAAMVHILDRYLGMEPTGVFGVAGTVEAIAPEFFVQAKNKISTRESSFGRKRSR